MNAVEQATEQEAAGTLARVQRPARGLLGWMGDGQARLFLSGRQEVPETPEHIVRIEQARAAVSARPVTLNQTDLVGDPPPELNSHIEALKQDTKAAAYFREGWTVQLVDLRRVYALQPSVFIDRAEERVASVDPANLGSIAGVSLPLPRPTMLPVQYDHARNAWIFTSPNPNLRIAGQFKATSEGHSCFGFAVEVSPSFLQVALFRGRYVLRDGYHRSYGLLKRGIAKAAALVREFRTFDELGLPPGLLNQEAYLGDRPPRLGDYFDDDVSAEALQPATEKLIVIQALELHTLG